MVKTDDKANKASAFDLAKWAKQPWLIEGRLVALPVVSLGPELEKYLEREAAKTFQAALYHPDDQTSDEVEDR